ncbi:MAG: hypothetical protein GY729_08185, partial [Desulfobacteraceae bacterium]|nr:hypothetical protein [Desulfobacteraceae bacterium]
MKKIICSMLAVFLVFGTAFAAPKKNQTDKTAAVKTQKVNSGKKLVKSDGTSVTAMSTNTPILIPDGDENGIESSISITEQGYVSDIKVNLNLTHKFNDDLMVYLVSPSGNYVALFDLLSYYFDDYNEDWDDDWNDDSNSDDDWDDDSNGDDDWDSGSNGDDDWDDDDWDSGSNGDDDWDDDDWDSGSNGDDDWDDDDWDSGSNGD